MHKTYNIKISADNMVAFDDLIIEEMSLNNVMTIECFGNFSSTTVSATSQLFHVYDAPTTGLMTEINTSFSYKGSLEYIQPILTAFNDNLGTMSCTGCPGGFKSFYCSKIN